MTPERLAELREDCRKAIKNGWSIVRLDPRECRDLLDAADNLAALLAAAEDVAKWLQDDRWGKWTYMESLDIYEDKDCNLRAMVETIRRAKREP